MILLDHTYHTPAENLACDEALLVACDEGSGPEILRFWESRRHFVVLGYTNCVRDEVDEDACRRLGIPLFRRYSGGGTVLQGPGCLNYSLILRIPGDGPLSSITGTTVSILERNAAALQTLLTDPVTISGTSDLAMNGMKFSGNAQRRLRAALLFHGTVLFGFDITLVEAILRMPPRQPAYRGQRTHRDFLRNFPAEGNAVRTALRTAWHAAEDTVDVPVGLIRRLAEERYADDRWTYRR